MKKITAILLALLLALTSIAALADAPTVITCPEEGFTAMVSFPCTTKWVKNDGLYIYTATEGYMPYILIAVDYADNRFTDDTAFSDILYPALQDAYSQYGGTSMQILGGAKLAGRDVYAAEFQFKLADGARSWLYYVIDAREDCSIYYRLRTVDESELPGLKSCLEAVGWTIQLDAPEAVEPQPAPAPQASGDAQNLVITDITQDGMLMGRCAAPADWQVSGKATSCTTAQSISNPWTLTIQATAPSGSFMGYTSARDYLQINRWDGGPKHQDGAYCPYVHTTMLNYKNASAYCDFIAQMLAPKGRALTIEAEETFPQAQPLIEEKVRRLSGGGFSGPYLDLNLESVDVSVCMRRYALEVDGVPTYICVLSGVEAYHVRVELPGIYVSIVKDYVVWQAPYNYVMVCRQDEWAALEPVFTQFVENTSASDQFVAANKRLADELWSIVNMKENMNSGLSRSLEVMRSETASGDTYDEGFTDYLFDQNDYTLSDGSHVKVSTEYDYVYQLDNGNVVYTDSALYEPGGATQLYPNR